MKLYFKETRLDIENIIPFDKVDLVTYEINKEQANIFLLGRSFVIQENAFDQFTAYKKWLEVKDE